MNESEFDSAVDSAAHSLTERRFKKPAPPELFHYTDEHVMLQILQSGRMWAGHLGFMNDTGEGSHALELFREALEASTALTVPPQIEHWLTETEFVNKEGAYIVSLSEEGDLLSQWRAYAADGRGYAIQISPGCVATTETLWGVAEHTAAARVERVPPLMGPLLIRCIYDEPEKRAIMSELTEMLGRLMRTDTTLEPDTHITMAWSGVLRVLTLCALSFKSSAFREEREWRLVWLGSTSHLVREDKRSILRFRSTRFGLSPYLDWSLRTDELWKAIPSITCGPRIDRDRMQKTFPQFLNWLEFPAKSVELRFSAATYR